jgi:hypothetical protein
MRSGSALAGWRQVTDLPAHDFIERQDVIRGGEAGSKDWSRPGAWKLIEDLLR